MFDLRFGPNWLWQVMIGACVAVAQTAAAHPQGFVAHNMRRLDHTVYFHRLAPVPPYAARRVPKNGQTTFYGYRRMLVAGKSPVVFRIHCYRWTETGAPLPAPQSSTIAPRRARKNPRLKDQNVLSSATLYVQPEPGAAFRLVMTADFDAGEGGVPLTFVEPLWLDPDTRTTPMIRFCCQHRSGFYGPYGWNTFVVFDAGANNAPATQKFEHSSSHIDFIDWNFDARDAPGRRRFIQLIDPLGEGQDALRSWTWDQTTRSFVQSPEPPTKAPH